MLNPTFFNWLKIHIRICACGKLFCEHSLVYPYWGCDYNCTSYGSLLNKSQILSVSLPVSPFRPDLYKLFQPHTFPFTPTPAKPRGLCFWTYYLTELSIYHQKLTLHSFTTIHNWSWLSRLFMLDCMIFIGYYFVLRTSKYTSDSKQLQIS